MSVDDELRKTLIRNAESFEPDVERSLDAVRQGARRRRRQNWTISIVAVVAVAATVIAAPWSGGREVVAEPSGPGINRWSTVPAAPLSARHDAVGAWLGGRFVIAGGSEDPICPATASCIRNHRLKRDGAAYDASTRTWTPIAVAPLPVAGAGVVVGDQLYVLGDDDHASGRAARMVSYDAADDRWRELPAPPRESMTLVAAGRFVVALSPSDEQGGGPDFVFDPSTSAWHNLPDDPLGPSYDREAVWIGDSLLLAGKELIDNPGAEKPSVVRLARLDAGDDAKRWPTGLNSRSWTRLPDSEVIGWHPLAVGSVVVWPELGSADGGRIGNWGRDFDYGGIFDPADGSWRPLPDPPSGRGFADDRECCPLVAGHRVLVGGHLLDPVTRTWTRLPRLPQPDRQSATTIAGPDSIMVWGGGTEAKNLADGYQLPI